MRTSVVIPGDLIERVRRSAGTGSLSAFVREAVRERVDRIEYERLAQEMEQGYRSEARDSSLDPEWGITETEGLT